MTEIPATLNKQRMAAFVSLVGGKEVRAAGPQSMTVEEARNRVWEKRGKYGNKKTEYGGRMFDSKHEAGVAQALDIDRKERAADRRVVKIEYQVRFPITVKGKKICTYVADFVATYASGRVAVIDAKVDATKTPVYKLKKKLMLAVHGIDILEW